MDGLHKERETERDGQRGREEEKKENLFSLKIE